MKLRWLAKLSAFVLLFTMVFQYGVPNVEAAITFDGADCNPVTGSAVFTTTTTVSNADIAVTLYRQASNSAPDAITWDGNAMTQLTPPVATGVGSIYIHAYYYLNPAAGTGIASVDGTGATGFGSICSATYDGIDTTSPLDAALQANFGNSTSWTDTFTTTNDDAMIMGLTISSVNSAISGTGDTTVRNDEGTAANGRIAWLDDGPVTPAGAESVSVSFSSSDYEYGILSLKAAAAAAATPSQPQPYSYGTVQVGTGMGMQF